MTSRLGRTVSAFPEQAATAPDDQEFLDWLQHQSRQPFHSRDTTMREIAVPSLANPHRAGVVRFGKAHPDANTAVLHLREDAATARVLLNYHGAVALMADLGAFVANTPTEDDIAVMDLHGRQGGGLVSIVMAPTNTATVALHVANHTDNTTAAVLLDHQAATALMAELGAFAATS